MSDIAQIIDETLCRLARKHMFVEPVAGHKLANDNGARVPVLYMIGPDVFDASRPAILGPIATLEWNTIDPDEREMYREKIAAGLMAMKREIEKPCS